MQFNRYGVTVGKRTYTWKKWTETYCCKVCGGMPVAHSTYDPNTNTITYAPRCGQCDATEFINGSTFQRQMIEGWEVLVDLPADIADMLK